MSEIKSPFSVMRTEYYFDTDIRPCQMSDEAAQQRKVVLRASRMRPASPGGLLLGFAINALLWILGISVGYYCWQVFGPYVKDLASWAWELVQ
jgi:hypothetical protein